MKEQKKNEKTYKIVLMFLALKLMKQESVSY